MDDCTGEIELKACNVETSGAESHTSEMRPLANLPQSGSYSKYSFKCMNVPIAEFHVRKEYRDINYDIGDANCRELLILKCCVIIRNLFLQSH